MPLPVYLKGRQPNSAHLLVWGRHDTGWWGCVAFRARVHGDGELELDVAAWVPARDLTKPGWIGDGNGADLGRIRLPDDQRRWPAPPRWPSWYAGPWPDGPLSLPPGVVLVTGAAWRTRPSRAPRPRNVK